jgi:CheY-like chemotaxis protein
MVFGCALSLGPSFALMNSMASTRSWNDSLHGVCVVVAELEQDGQRLLSSLLRYCGAYVKPAHSAKEALAHMENLLPDAMIIRLSTSDMFSLVGRIRTLEPDVGGTVPIVAIGRALDRERSAIPGCDAYLVEPIEPWDLCRLVVRLVTGER